MPARFSKRLLLSLGLASLALVLTGCNTEKAEATPSAEASAAQAKQEKPFSGDEITPDYVEMVRNKFASVRPDLKVEKVEKTEVAGINQVFFEGKGAIYMAADANFFFSGDLFAIQGNQIVNVTEEKSNGPRAELMAGIDRKDMIIFSPKGEVKASVTVFTDVDCGYCRKLHQEVPAMNEKGIEIKYLAYPRAGVGSPSYEKIASAWCAEDRNTALSKLKAGENIPNNVCENNPVPDQFNIGVRAGLSGTPALILESGRLIPGYMTADQLAQALGI